MPLGAERITTTLDARLQTRVDAILAEQLRRLDTRNVRDAAAVVLDNRTGAVLAWVGIGYASTSRLPALLLAARQDDSVNPQRNTAGLAQALSQAGAPVVTRAFDRVNHATLVGAMAWPLRLLAPVLDEVTAFVAATPPASPSTPPAPAA